MSYGRKWRPSKTARREFAQTMNEIAQFCADNGIVQSSRGDSYYFTIEGKHYRVSNHTIAASNARAFNEFGEQVRELYHSGNEDVHCITASKTRIIEIFNALKDGKTLDKRGYVVG